MPLKAEEPYTFSETKGMEFFKRDVRDRQYSTSYNEALAGQASRNGIVIAIFGGNDTIFQRVERTVGKAHARSVPVAMAIFSKIPESEIPKHVKKFEKHAKPDAVIKVYYGGIVSFSGPIYAETPNIEYAVAQMIDQTNAARVKSLESLNAN